jgi:GTPase SAR1 family protein
MGNLAQRVWKRYQGIQEARIFLAGLDSAGKTTILYTLSLGPKLPSEFNTIPTIGFNVEKVKYGKVEFTMWDAGHNHNNIRALVRHYYANS